MATNDGVTEKLLRPLLLATAVATAIYGVAVFLGNPGDVWALAKSLTGPVWILMLSFLGISWLLRFLRWQRYLSWLGHAVQPGRSLAYYVGGFAFTVIPAKAGEVVRSVYLKAENVPYRSSIAAFLAERLLDVVVLVLLSTAILLEYLGVYPAVLLMVSVAASIVLLTFLARYTGALRLLVKRLVPKNDLIGREGVGSTLKQLSTLLRGRLLLEGTLIGLAAWTVEATILYVLLDNMGSNISYLTAVSAWAAGMLAGALSFLPGGIGGAEAAMGGFLLFVGVEASTVVSAVLIYRITTLWLAVLIGAVVVFFLEVARKRASKESSA